MRNEGEKMITRKVTRREMLKLAGTAAVGTVLAACGAPAASPQAPAATSAPAAAAVPPTQAPAAVSGPVTVSVMHDPKEFTEDMIKQFESANPDIKLEVIKTDMTRFYAMAAAGNPPDVVRVQAPDLPQMLALQLLLDLTPYFNTSSLLKVDDLAPANNYYKAESPTQFGSGSIYGMVKDWSPDFTLFIYTAAFEEAEVPVPDTTKSLTYDELADLGQKLTKVQGDKSLRWGFDMADGWIDRIWMNMLAEKGQSLYTSDYMKINLVNNDEARKAAQYFFDLQKANVMASPVNPSPNWIGDDFNKGLVGIIQYGYWFSAMAESDVTKDKVVMLPSPTWAGERRDPTMTATGTIISSKTKNPDAAWKVFEWYHGGAPSVERAKGGWGVPGLKSQYAMIPTDTAFQKQARAILEAELPYTGDVLQFNPYISGDTVFNLWNKYVEQALRGSLSFDDMLNKIEAEVNTAIQEGADRIG
jgi:multiple sugar transport system substrate-binding protein